MNYTLIIKYTGVKISTWGFTCHNDNDEIINIYLRSYMEIELPMCREILKIFNGVWNHALQISWCHMLTAIG